MWGALTAHVHEAEEVDGQRSLFIKVPRFLQQYAHAAELRAAVAAIEFPAERKKMFGHDVPRDQRWFAQNGKPYTFSGSTHHSEKWPAELAALAKELTSFANEHLAERRARTPSLKPADFASAHANRYRSGADSVSAHSDKELCLGINPTIASISIGGTRTMHANRKTEKVFAADRKYHRLPESVKATFKAPKLSFELADGDLLLFAGASQVFWQHWIDKEPEPIAARTNLTFRPHHSEA
jgi:alkylated DNA repair dioxygenase AlkB